MQINDIEYKFSQYASITCTSFLLDMPEPSLKCTLDILHNSVLE